MTNKWNIAIPETPSPNYVLVKQISLESTEQTVKEFFLFCGKIKEFELKADEDDEKHKIALIHFERESAAKTAVLLSNALIDESHITAQPYFDIPATATTESEKSAPADAEGQNDTQEAKSKARIAAEILAQGYILQDHVVAKGLEYDNKYNVSSRFSGLLGTLQSGVNQLDEKFRIWDKAADIDKKYKIQEKVQTAAQTAQAQAQAALQTPTGQKVHEFANQTLAQIAAVHYQAKDIQGEKLGANATANPSTASEKTTETTASAPPATQ